MNFLDQSIHDALVQCAGPICVLGICVFLIIMAAFFLGDGYEKRS